MRSRIVRDTKTGLGETVSNETVSKTKPQKSQKAKRARPFRLFWRRSNQPQHITFLSQSAHLQNNNTNYIRYNNITMMMFAANNNYTNTSSYEMDNLVQRFRALSIKPSCSYESMLQAFEKLSLRENNEMKMKLHYSDDDANTATTATSTEVSNYQGSIESWSTDFAVPMDWEENEQLLSMEWEKSECEHEIDYMDVDDDDDDDSEIDVMDVDDEIDAMDVDDELDLL